MNYHAKRKLVRHSTYIVLALIICSIMCLTVVAFVSAQRAKKKPTPAVPDTLDNQTNNADPFDQTDSTDSTTPNDTPTNNDPSDNEEPDLPTSSEDKPAYVLPADGYVLKGFSVDLPVWSMTMEDYRAHTGIDVSAACGSAVYAMSSGVITDISEDPLMGISITVIHDDGNTALYQNLASEMPEGIQEGATVIPGQIIASVGDTAMIEQCETDHLHLELYSPDGERINPETLLDFSDLKIEDVGTE